MYQRQGRYDQAEALHLPALAHTEQALGKHHLEVAVTLRNLGQLYAAQRKWAAAEQACLRALEIRERMLGPEHIKVAECLAIHAAILKQTRRPKEAARAETRVKAILAGSAGQTGSTVDWRALVHKK
ncbi:MAG: tetratricopeptide repeat protein [Longimicrobiales bacterium]